MIGSINSSADSFLANIERLQARAERAQRQISSGLRVINPSDDPDQVGAILQTSSNLARNEQIGRNLGLVKAEVDGAEQALSAAILTLEGASVVGAQGANFAQTAATRSGLALEVENLLKRLVANANTNVVGRYVFSGDSDQVAAYSVDLTTATGTTAYAGTASTREVADPRGGAIPVSQSAQQIFDAPGASAFAAVNDLRVALLANDEPGIKASIEALRIAHDRMSDSLSFYGLVQNEVADGLEAAKALTLRLTADLSEARSADLVEASSELIDARLHLDATFSARARVPGTSLFDYLG